MNTGLAYVLALSFIEIRSCYNVSELSGYRYQPNDGTTLAVPRLVTQVHYVLTKFF